MSSTREDLMDPDHFDTDAAMERAQSLIERSRQLEHEVSSIDIDVQSPDKSVAITISMSGEITDLQLERNAIEGKVPEEVARSILAVIQAAQNAATRAGQDLAKRYLPDLPDLGRLFDTRN